MNGQVVICQLPLLKQCLDVIWQLNVKFLLKIRDAFEFVLE